MNSYSDSKNDIDKALPDGSAEEAEDGVTVGEPVSEDEEVLSEDEDVSSEGEEVPSEDEEVSSEGEEVPSEDEEVSSEDEEVLSEDEEVLSEGEEVLSEDEEVLSEDEEVLFEDEEVLSEDEEALSEDEDVSSEDEDVSSEGEEVLSEDEDVLSEDEEVLSEDEDVLSEDEEVLYDDEGAPSEDEEVISEDEEALSEDEEAIDEDEEAVDEGEGAIDEDEEAVDEGEEAIDEGEEAVNEDEEAVDEGEEAIDEDEEAIDEDEEVSSEDEVDLFALADKEDDESDMVDLYALVNHGAALPSMENHGAFYYWYKRKRASDWVSFGLKCAGAVLLLICLSAVLYVNGLLNLIDYRAADDFRQYFNLSDTDYSNDNVDVYSSPVYYNESTTLEGFDESMIDIPKKDVINILLIGTDVRGGTYDDRGNTDSMILMSVNTRDKNIKLTSFMRDLYVNIPDREWQRLNASYAYGGPQLLFDTLKENFDVDVDLYVRVNFANFRKIINKVGGVDIELTEAEARYMNKYAYKYKTDPVEPGLQRLDGAQALSYARCRKIDSDFNRTQRQRTVILAFVKEIKHCSITELNSLLNTVLPMIQTNMSKRQILSLLADSVNYLNHHIETLNIPVKNSWQSVTIRNMSVICPNFELNKTAIVAHIYSTYRLDVDSTVYQSFNVPGNNGGGSYSKTTRSADTPTQSSETEATAASTEEPSDSTEATSAPSTAAPTTETAAPTAAPTEAPSEKPAEKLAEKSVEQPASEDSGN